MAFNVERRAVGEAHAGTAQELRITGPGQLGAGAAAARPAETSEAPSSQIAGTWGNGWG